MALLQNSRSAHRIFKKFYRMKGANWYIEILLVVFWEKNSFGAIWSFYHLGDFLLFDWAWSNWARPLLIGSSNSQGMISFMITTGSLNSQDLIKILKQWRYDFSDKNLCDGYCMNIIWCDVSFLKNLLHKFVWM